MAPNLKRKKPSHRSITNAFHYLAAPAPLRQSSFHRGRNSLIEQQLLKLHVVGSVLIATSQMPAGPIISTSKVSGFLRWLTEKELGIAWVMDRCQVHCAS